MACINPNTPEFKAALERAGGNPMLAEIELSKSLEVKPVVAKLFDYKRSFADYSDFGKTLSEQEIINLKKEGNKVTAKQFLESIIPVNDFEKKLKSFLLSIDLNKLNGFDFIINDKYQGNNIIGLNERDLFEKPTVIFNSKSTTKPSRYKLHEFLHSLLDTVINEEQEFRTELITLFDYVKTLPEFKNEYGVIGWWEFYTEGMTNPDFQAKLKNVTLSGYKGGKKSNVYEEFVKIINGILEKLGFLNKDYSALNEIINATTKVIEKRYGYDIKPGVEQKDLIPQIEELNNFQLFEDLDKLCGEGVCNFTALKSTKKLEDVGLNPYPNQYDGANLAVSVKSPIGDFNITHYVSAVAINDGIYIYDMPQNEFISNNFFGKGDIPLKTTYKPRLIPLTLDSIKANYNLNSEESAKFIRSILTTKKSNLKPSFKSYIEDNINNSSQYILDLENQISKENVLLDSVEEYKLKNEKEEDLKEQFIEAKLNKKLTLKEENKVINFLRNKLKFKTKEYLPTKTTEFTLRNIIRSVTGLEFEYNKENFDKALEEFKNYIDSEKFLIDVVEKYSNSKEKLDGINKSLDYLFSFNRLLTGFFKLAESIGIEKALLKYDKTQEYNLREFFPSDIKTKYKSDKQAIFLLRKKYSNLNNLTKDLNLEFGKSVTDIYKNKFKLNATYEKANTVLNYLKAVDFDASYIYESIENEAKRRYAYFSKQEGQVYFQQEEQSTEKPSENIDNKIKSFLASIGVNIKIVQDLTDSKGNKLSGIAVADMLNKIIQVVDGKADITTLSEEAAHFFVEMLGESNPLYKQMFDKITSYKIYSETVDQYRNNKAYKNADGTLNINKLKKEAIGKLIMTHIIKNETNNENKDKINSAKSWWSKLLEWIKNVFKQTSTNPFAEAAQKIINNDISDLNLDVESNETYFQLEAQSGIEKVIKDQDVIKLDESINPKTGEKKHIYTENGKDIIDKNGNPRSVTNNVVDPWYKNRFPTDSRTTIRKTIDEFSAEKGTDIHADLESILRRFVDKNGDIKATPSPISKIKTNDVIYAKLEQYVMSLLNEFKGKPGTKFLAEVRLYNRKRNLPGTIDLLIMEPDGTTHIYDWKSQQINKDQTELKWFKPLAYRIQLGEYKKILMEEYGIYKFGKIRAIPIATKYTIANVNGKLTPTGLKDIEMEYDIKNIPTDKNYLLPVVMLDESTNDPKLDSLIAKLNAVYEKISIGDVQESEKAFKHDELNILKKAINDLHIRKDMTVFIENGLYEINKYYRKIKDNTFGLKDIKDSLLILNVYAEGSVYLEKLFVDIKNQLKTETNPDIKEYLQNLQEDFLKMSQNAKALLIDIKGIPGEKNPSGVMARLGNEFAQEEGITTLLNPEVQMDFWKRNFRSLTTLSTAAMNTFAKILRRVQAQRNIKIKDLNSKLQTLRKEHEEWARKKGLTGENIFNPILEIDSKGNWNGDFVRIYSAEYFKLRDEALKNEDVNWIKQNTDFDNDGYKKDLENFKNNVEERYPEKNEKTESRKQNLIERWVERHSPDSKVAYLNKKNFYIKPKAKWQSEKYKTIYAKDSSGKYINEPLKNTYEFFQELIKYSSQIGMLDRYSSRFIPGVYQSAITNIIGSSFKNIYDIQSKFESLVVDSEGGFGNIDPLTGVLKKQMKVYFKKDLGVQNEDGTFDYSNKSKDLFSVFSIWGQQMYNYESMDSIRDKSDILLEIEKIKPRLETNMWSVVKDDKTTIAENSVNAGILEDYINYYIYGEIKGSDVDKAVTINGKDYSLKQATQKVIKAATFKTLALNLLSGTATFVGGTGNAFFQASKKLIFTEKDWIQGTADFTSNNEVTSLGIDFFDLGLDDREKNDVRNLSTSWKKRNMKWDHLLFMQHYGDKWATYPVAAAMLRTFMFDGKNIVSIRDFVKKQNDYDNFYKLPEGERKRVQKKIDKEIEELQNTKSLKAVGKVENGKFSIPGLEQGSDAAINFRAVVQKTLKGVIGNATRDDMTTLRMGLIGQVLMQFRSWMPQMMAERFGDMTYDVDLETWQYGKARLFVQHLVDGRILPLVKEMIFGFGNNTIEKAKEKYKEFVVQLLAEGKITSEKDFMTEAEFVDMYMGNVRSMMREILLLASFFFLLFLGAGDDDDEDEDVSGFKKYAIKALQKYQNEFSFYYSPTEFTKMLKNPVPLIGVLEDFERFLTQGIGQVYNFGIGDEEGMEKNKPAKYLFKLLPITKEGLNFYALYDDEFRKEWAIK